MIIEDLGAEVASVWERLRPSTRSLVERALHSAVAAQETRPPSVFYDAHAEWELSRLLAVLDDRAIRSGATRLTPEQTRELGHVADTCALVLSNEARSAEVYAQLFMRALRARNYARVDVLADTLPVRLAPSEVCELARHLNPAVRAIARETLLHAPTPMLIELLADPVDAEVARDALERKADELDSDEARWIVSALERVDAIEDDEDM